MGKLGIEPISEKVSPHSLRRTYASLRFALGDDPVRVAEQLCHEEVGFSMNVYAKAIKRRSRLKGAYLAEFDRAAEWAGMGSNPGNDAQSGSEAAILVQRKRLYRAVIFRSAPIAQLDRATPPKHAKQVVTVASYLASAAKYGPPLARRSSAN